MDRDDAVYYERPTWFPGDHVVILAGYWAFNGMVIRDNGLYVLVDIEGQLYTALWHYDDGVLVFAPDGAVDAPAITRSLH